MNVYCAFCRTTCEEKIARHISRLYGPDGIKAFAPVRILKERSGGRVHKVCKPLIEGYVFIYCDQKIAPRQLSPVRDIIKLLRYPNGEYELAGADLEYAKLIYGNNGVLNISDVLCAGGEVNIVSGPLLEYRGTIVKLDKRKQRAFLRVTLGGVVRDISLSVNILSVV